MLMWVNWLFFIMGLYNGMLVILCCDDCLYSIFISKIKKWVKLCSLGLFYFYIGIGELKVCWYYRKKKLFVFLVYLLFNFIFSRIIIILW